MADNVWVVPFSNGWGVQRENDPAVLKTFTTQAKAMSYGRELAKRDQVEFIVKGQNGKIRFRDSYCRASSLLHEEVS